MAGTHWSESHNFFREIDLRLQFRSSPINNRTKQSFVNNLVDTSFHQQD